MNFTQSAGTKSHQRQTASSTQGPTGITKKTSTRQTSILPSMQPRTVPMPEDDNQEVSCTTAEAPVYANSQEENATLRQAARLRCPVKGCELASKVHVSFDKRFRHMQIVHGLRNICNLCDEAFSTAEELWLHHIATYDINIRCETCGDLYETGIQLHRHITTIHIQGSVECRECDTWYWSATSKRKHIQGVHSPPRDLRSPINPNTLHCGEHRCESSSTKLANLFAHQMSEFIHLCLAIYKLIREFQKV